MTIADDALDLLANGGSPAAKFESPGDKTTGKVVSAQKRQQADYGTGAPKFYDDGNPMWEVVITVDTGEDDGKGDTCRRLFARGAMLKAVREALHEANAKLEVGGELVVKYTEDGEPPKKGFNPPKLFKAKYTPPAPSAVDLDDL
jgi:hypothetical protein